jgi:hypothetical protein
MNGEGKERLDGWMNKVGMGYCTIHDPFGPCLFGSCFLGESPYFQLGHF